MLELGKVKEGFAWFRITTKDSTSKEAAVGSDTAKMPMPSVPSLQPKDKPWVPYDQLGDPNIINFPAGTTEGDDMLVVIPYPYLSSPNPITLLKRILHRR